MKQATQLQIQWPDEALAARPSCGAGFYEAFQHLSEGLAKSVTKPSRKISIGMWLRQENRAFSTIAGESLSNLKALQGAAAVIFGFTLVFFAALIGG